MTGETFEVKLDRSRRGLPVLVDTETGGIIGIIEAALCDLVDAAPGEIEEVFRAGYRLLLPEHDDAVE